MASLEYVAYLAATLFFALAIRHVKKIPFASRAEGVALAASLIVFGAWDVLASTASHWSFGVEHTLGVVLLGMPLEEGAFFLVIPYLYLSLFQLLVKNKKG